VEDSLAPEIQLADQPPRQRVVNGQPTEAFLERMAARAAHAAEAFKESSDAMVDGSRLTPEVQGLIQRCLEGTEPAELRGWEQARFTPGHINIVLMKVAGFKNREIAQALKLTATNVAIVVNHPYGRKIMAALVPESVPRVLDIRTRMEAYASEILDHVVDLALATDDVDKARQVGFGLLDRIGHGPIQKGINAQVPPSALGFDGKSEGNPHLLGRLASALEESNRLDKELMPTWTPRLPPEEGSLPGGVEFGLDGEDAHREEGP